MDSKQFDLLIIGGGAAGYSAAIYARRYNLTVGIVEQTFGGYTALAGVIENYPGARKVDGFALMETMRAQAVEDNGAEHIEGAVTAVTGEQHCFIVTVVGGGGSGVGVEYQSKALILAMGMEHRVLNLPREHEYRTRGVHFCATCDGPVYNGKPVAVVGGGDSAVKSAVQLADMGAAHVTLIVREDSVDRAEPVNRDRLAERIAAGKVTVLYEAEVTEYLGGPPLTGVRLRRGGDGTISPPPARRGRSRGGGLEAPTTVVAATNADGTPSASSSMGGGETDVLPISALFISIGSIPRTALAQQLGVRLTPKGEIDVESETMKTNVDGVYAAGDVCDAAWGFKQTITSAAQGAIAATSVYRDLSEHGGLACPMHAMVASPPTLPATLP